jgi:magnesium-transporting ATPase (P-type)
MKFITNLPEAFRKQAEGRNQRKGQTQAIEIHTIIGKDSLNGGPGYSLINKLITFLIFGFYAITVFNISVLGYVLYTHGNGISDTVVFIFMNTIWIPVSLLICLGIREFLRRRMVL